MKKTFLLELKSSLHRKEKGTNVTSSIQALLGAKKISETIDVTQYHLMQRKGINLCYNLEIQVLLLLRELVSLNDEVEYISVLEFVAYNDVRR
jgi:hypothetical protein